MKLYSTTTSAIRKVWLPGSRRHLMAKAITSREIKKKRYLYYISRSLKCYEDLMEQAILKTIREHRTAIENFEQNSIGTIKKIVQIIVECLKNEGTVYLCGNGGSAADCQHIAGEFIGRFRKERDALPAAAFSTDTSVITCIGNDYSFDDIFVRQAQALVKKRDILWAFSTSGNSQNVVKAAKLAREKGARVIAFTGKPASQLEHIADVCFWVETSQTSTAQEVHMLAYHIICELVEVGYTKG